jgi:osmoprotectant transport system permease protein
MDFVNAFPFIGHHWSLISDKLEEHLVLSFIPIGAAVVAGVLLGVLLGHIHRFSFLAINVSNIGRALPSLAILAICLPFLGLGAPPVYIAMFVLGFPPILTNSYVAIDQVDPDTVDAAKGIGLRPWQVLTQVELPLGLPLIFAGIRTSAVFIVATATLGGIFSAGGLGDIIVNRESYGLDGVLAASYILVVLAFVIQGVLLVVERLVTPTGLKPGRMLRPVSTGDDNESPSVASDALVTAGTNIE